MTNQEKAEKALKNFLKELGKNGFTKNMKKYLNLVWQGDIPFNNALEKLKGIKYKIGDYKFINYDTRQKMYRFEVVINKEITNIFVQPLHEVGVPFDGGFYGAIPVKLFKFSKVLDEAIKEISKDIKNLNPETKEEKDHQNIYIKYLKDGGKTEDFASWLVEKKSK